MKNQISESSISSTYKRLSSSSNIPRWDTQSPITTSDKEAFDKLIIDVDNVSKIFSNQSELKVRKSNKKINDLLDKENDIKLALSIGSFIDKYANYSITYNALNKIDKNITIFKLSSSMISINDIAKLVGDFDTKKLEILIKDREQKNNFLTQKAKNY